jgi:hypothetical protein
VFLDRAGERAHGELIGGVDGVVDGLSEALVLRDLDAQGDRGPGAWVGSDEPQAPFSRSQ